MFQFDAWDFVQFVVIVVMLSLVQDSRLFLFRNGYSNCMHGKLPAVGSKTLLALIVDS